MTEDIITELSKIKGLKVLSRQAVLPFRDKPVATAQVGQQLRAACVLAGSIRRGGNRLRISAQLVDVESDALLWSERYDREMADVFEVQDEIARKIAGGAARPALAPGAGGDRGQADRERAGLRPLPARPQLREAPGAAGPRVRAAALRERGGPGPGLRPGLRRHGQRLRRLPLQLRARGVLARAGPRRLGEGDRAPAGPPRGQGGAGVDPLRERRLRRDAPHRALGGREEAGHGERLLPPPARPLLLRPVPGDRGHRRGGDRRERRGLQRLRAHPERARRARQAGRPQERAPARHPGLRGAPAPGARGRARPHPAGGGLRLRRADRRGDAGGRPRHGAAAERRQRALQRGLRLLHDEQEGRGDGRPRPGVEGRASGTPTGCAATPTSTLLHGEPEFERLYPAGAGEAGQ